jgi:hypothetical protein
MRTLFVIALALCWSGGTAASELVKSYGWVEGGGLVAFPRNAVDTQYGWGFAFSTGAMFFDHLQVGARLRRLTMTEQVCGPNADRSFSCNSDWDSNLISLGLELRWRLALSSRLALALGGSASAGLYGGCLGNDGCGMQGADLAADVRLLFLLGKRIGVHLAYEQQVLYVSPTLVMPSFWLGLDW